jgi:hypothetical protein
MTAGDWIFVAILIVVFGGSFIMIMKYGPKG